MTIIEALVQHQAAVSRADARRLIAQGAVRISGQVIATETREVASGDHVRVGKMRAFTIGS